MLTHQPIDLCHGGILAKGSSWSRPKDVAGIGGNLGWISDIHAKYLGMGGIDGFVGDGAITAGAEKSLDLFYSANFGKDILADWRLPAHHKSRL